MISPGKFLSVIWNVIGTDQHGEDISFDVETLEEAEKHRTRYTRLGGSVRIQRLIYNGPKAAWIPYHSPEGDECFCMVCELNLNQCQCSRYYCVICNGSGLDGKSLCFKCEGCGKLGIIKD